ncbi:hypothetical protein [Streptomyces zingiberis]|uniref:Uncharacterized protein n=1 Tax=Streptomyces zingiberis TaxID=2053010 RepID=A0ABX1BQL8_9ACTN|nr:hypothetical protein [Streptomyces zingiberis]NJQ00030.1 hypothetical protein [Streptomyces zingiberis]
MCGACGRTIATDAWSDVLSTGRARWEAARLVNLILEGSGHPARVNCAARSWTVRSGTGRTVLVDTVERMWQVLLEQRGPRLDVAGVLGGRPVTPVLAAVTAAARAAGGPGPSSG